MSRNRWILSGTLLSVTVAAGVAGFAIHGALSGAATSVQNGQATQNCAIRDQTYVEISMLPSFEATVDNTMNGLPFRRDGGASTGFVAGRYKGALASIAISGPDRASEDQRAKALHYPIGRIPLVPLQGPVVEHNPGPLEWLEAHMIFSSATAASAWLVSDQDPKNFVNGGAPEQTFSPGIGQGSYGLITTLGPKAPGNETLVSVETRLDNVVVQYTIQGGSSVDSTTIIPYAEHGLKLLQQQCGLT